MPELRVDARRHLVRELRAARDPRGNLRAIADLQARRIGHSLLALVFRPGLLTAEYRDGQRARAIAPWRLLLNVVTFFFLLSVLTDFRVTSVARQDSSGTLSGLIVQRAQQRHLEPTLMLERIERRFSSIYTLLLSLTVVSYTLLAAATHWRASRRWDVHAVFALHLVAWIFLTSIPYLLLIQALHISPVETAGANGNLAGAIPLLAWIAAMYAYVMLAFRRVYADGIAGAAAKSLLLIVVGVVVDNLVLALAFFAALYAV